jgi:hypothetical protein
MLKEDQEDEPRVGQSVTVRQEEDKGHTPCIIRI